MWGPEPRRVLLLCVLLVVRRKRMMPAVVDGDCRRLPREAGCRRGGQAALVELSSPKPGYILGAVTFARSASHSGSRFPGSNLAATSAVAQTGSPALRAPSRNSAAEVLPGR
jgi:hypothetical protein